MLPVHYTYDIRSGALRSLILLFACVITTLIDQVSAGSDVRFPGWVEPTSGNEISGWLCTDQQTKRSAKRYLSIRNTLPIHNPTSEVARFVIEPDTIPTQTFKCPSGLGFQFNFTLTNAQKSRIGPGSHQISVYVVDPGQQTHVHLGDIHGFQVSGTKVPIHRKYKINTSCHALLDQDWKIIWVNDRAHCKSSSSWNIRGTNEDSKFQSPQFFLPTTSLHNPKYAQYLRNGWKYSFIEKPDKTFLVKWSLSKLEHHVDRDRYSGAFLNDADFSKHTTLDENIYLDLNLSLEEVQGVNDPIAGPPKMRVTFGVVAKWKDSTGSEQKGFVEINLYRTENFDLCTKEANTGGRTFDQACDPDGIYDRRHFFGNGEIVYYNAAVMSRSWALQPPADRSSSPSAIHYTIPIGALFRYYAWTKPPDRWSDAHIHGVYFGHEIWGRGRISTSVSDLGLYTFHAN